MSEIYNKLGLVDPHLHDYIIIKETTMTYPKGYLVCSICGIKKDDSVKYNRALQNFSSVRGNEN